MNTACTPLEARNASVVSDFVDKALKERASKQLQQQQKQRQRDLEQQGQGPGEAQREARGQQCDQASFPVTPQKPPRPPKPPSQATPTRPPAGRGD
ncbi:hypothetical protein PLESTF_000986500 [Pleodorina starrii]|nr:hypothetical protein PLESTM_001923900 [Pleodorina starrii]GLC70483.1 hypothetical protein PLESTF_000986500 [Pleodorina starrii]